jgi:hypothetical protein
MVHDRSTGKRQSARHGVSGANELSLHESTDRPAGFEQPGDLAGRQVRQAREPDHGGAKHICRGDQVVLAVENTNLGGHAVIMSRSPG